MIDIWVNTWIIDIFIFILFVICIDVWYFPIYFIIIFFKKEMILVCEVSWIFKVIFKWKPLIYETVTIVNSNLLMCQLRDLDLVIS